MFIKKYKYPILKYNGENMRKDKSTFIDKNKVEEINIDLGDFSFENQCTKKTESKISKDKSTFIDNESEEIVKSTFIDKNKPEEIELDLGDFSFEILKKSR